MGKYDDDDDYDHEDNDEVNGAEANKHIFLLQIIILII